MQILFLLFVAVFLTFLTLRHAASPEIINGEYGLNGHGKIIKYIPERDYLFLKGWELRLFASGWSPLRAHDALVISPARRVERDDARWTLVAHRRTRKNFPGNATRCRLWGDRGNSAS
jgi:hypothetical protein